MKEATGKPRTGGICKIIHNWEVPAKSTVLQSCKSSRDRLQNITVLHEPERKRLFSNQSFTFSNLYSKGTEALLRSCSAAAYPNDKLMAPEGAPAKHWLIFTRNLVVFCFVFVNGHKHTSSQTIFQKLDYLVKIHHPRDFQRSFWYS